MSNTLKNVMRIFILAALAIFQGQLAAAQEITYAADVAPILWKIVQGVIVQVMSPRCPSSVSRTPDRMQR